MSSRRVGQEGIRVIEDARKVPAATQLDVDVCVIGGGAAGITVAHELAGSGVTVAVLESGGDTPDPATQELYDGSTSGLPYYRLDEARLRYFGGSTNHWGRLCRPFDGHDLARKPWVPLSGWPFGLTEIAPYYQRAQPFLGLHTDIFSAAQWSRRDQYHPFRLGSEPLLVTRVAQLVTDGPLSLAPRYRAVLGAADNVTVYLHANVTSIEVDAPGRTATEVRVAVLSGPRFTVRARRFVLATGGIENPRVLLASNARFPTGLGNRHDAVGRYFLEHPRFVSGTLLPTADRASVGFYAAHNVGSSRIEAYLAPVDEVQRREQLVDVQVRLDPVYGSGFAKAIASDDAERLRAAVASARAGDLAGLERHVGGLASDLLTAPGYLLPGAPLPVPHPDVLARLATSTAVEREALLPALLGDTAAVGFLEATGRGPLRHLDVVTRIDPVPNRDSRVTLTGDRDALGMPRVDLDWRLSPLDRESVHRTMQLLVEQFGAHGLGRVRLTFDERSSGWPEDLVGGWHHMGTTRMSRDPRVGVVDPDCRVHGMSNLYVAGSSVFPTSGSGTPTMMIVALAIRLSEHLRRGL